MRKLMWVSLSLAILAGCTSKDTKCGDRALLLWPNAQGQYVLQEVPLEGLSSPYVLKGEAANIMFESGLNDSAFEGHTAEPRLTNARGVCVPEDAGSALAVNAYAQFASLYRFERELGTAGQLTWPRNVGVEIHLAGDTNDIVNNAHYFGAQDVIALVPYTQGDVPVAMNQGIVAHEHFHAHFQSQVINPLNQAMPQVVSSQDPFFGQIMTGQRPNVMDLAASGLGSARGLNNFVLRAWNEGLADFFAAIYTGHADFFDVSLKQPDRNLSLPLDKRRDKLISGDELIVRAGGLTGKTSADAVEVMTAYSYGEGSKFARLMYRLSQSGAEPPKVFLKRIMSRLSLVAAEVTPAYSDHVMNFDSIVQTLLGDFPVSRGAGCDALNAAVSEGVVKKGFSQCTN